MNDGHFEETELSAVEAILVILLALILACGIPVAVLYFSLVP